MTKKAKKLKKYPRLLKALELTVIIIGSLASVVLIYKGIISGHTTPIFTNNSIAEYTSVNLGGNDQSILIRGENKNNPVLLYIHGGPGNPETSFIVPFQSEWEKNFVVVNWDQLDSGRSFNKNIKQDEITTDRICSDAIELTHYLEKRFGVDKIYLVGHSYGSLVGMRCIDKSPDDFYAYIGTGQIGNQQKNETKLIDYARTMAKKDGNHEALKELDSLGSLPYTKDNFGKKLSVSRKWTAFYGGAIYGQKDTSIFNSKAVLRPEYNIIDYYNYFQGDAAYYSNTAADTARWELFTADFEKDIPSVRVPVYFVQGANDYSTSFDCCKDYFDMLTAPSKKLYKIDNAAHNVIFEKPEQFADILEKVLHDTK